MARDSNGTYSLPAGNPVVSGTSISSTTHNTTMSDIADELTDSLSRSGKGNMTAPLLLDDGSASNPGLAFASDENTGWYRPSADQLDVAVAGAKVFSAKTAGIEVQHASADDPAIEFKDFSSNLLGQLVYTGGTDFTLQSLEHGSAIGLQAEDTGGTLRNIVYGDPDGAARLYYTGLAAIATRDGGVSVNTGASGSAGILAIFDEATSLAITLSALSTETKLVSNIHSLPFYIRAEDSTGAEQTLFKGDPDAEAELYYDGTLAMLTADTGIKVQDTSGSVPVVALADDGATTLAQLLHNSATILQSIEHGSPVQLRGEDTGGTMRTLLSGDPDAELDLYHNGNLVFRTSTSGIIARDASGDDPIVELQADDASVLAHLIHVGTTGLKLLNLEHGTNLLLSGEDAAGAEQKLLEGDPDGTLDLYYDGVLSAQTSASGFKVQDTSGSSPVINMAQDDGTTLGQLLFVSGDTLAIRSIEHGSNVSLQAEDAGGTLRDLLEGDPDGALDLYYDATKTFETADRSTYGSGARVHDGGGNMQPVGFNVTPITNVTTSEDLRITNAGHHLHIGAGGSIDIDATTDNAPNGSFWEIANDSGGSINITATGVTLTWFDAAGGSTGTRAIADNGIAVVTKIANGDYIIRGAGIS